MSQERRVELSAVIVTLSDLSAIGPSLRALDAQTARDRLEVVVVCPGPCEDADGQLSGFAGAQILEVGAIETLGPALAAGVRAARGPIVAYSEEHSHPGPGWAEALIERHRGPWTGVGWAIENANPGSAASWAHLFADFGPGVAPVDSHESHQPLPWHHVSYKREELVAYGERLGELLQIEGMLQEEMLARGRRLFADGAAVSRHLNVTRLRPRIQSHFLGGREYAAARSHRGGWSRLRRIAYAAGFPLLALVRMWRLRPDLSRTRESRGRVRGLLPALAFNLAMDAAGEAAGYLRGAGSSPADRLSLELERMRYISST